MRPSIYFESWNCTAPEFPPRSRLYALEPIGVGTPFVESLTSYVTRLADAHGVSVGDLVRRELSVIALELSLRFIPAMPENNAPQHGLHHGYYAINGCTESAKSWVKVLERATRMMNLRLLTLLPFEDVFARRALSRQTRAWCPACFEDYQTSGTVVYEPLLWGIRPIKVCPHHHQPLEENCPHCHRSPRVLTTNSRPGYCSSCQKWLGRKSRLHAPHSGSPKETPDIDFSNAKAIGQLLAIVPDLNGLPLGTIFAANFRACVETVAEGSLRAFARVLEVPHRNLGSPLPGKRLPTIRTLLQSCQQLDVPITAFLESEPARAAGHWEHAKVQVRKRWAVSLYRTPENVRRTLEKAVCEQPPPHLSEIARRLNYKSTERLYQVARNLCKQISGNYRQSGQSYSQRQHGAAGICGKADTRAMLEQSLAQEHPVSVCHIAEDLGYVNDSCIRQQFPDLCHAIRSKIAAQKQSRLVVANRILDHALRENPVPALPELCKRLGYAKPASLQRHFPIVYDQILAQQRAIHDQQSAELRKMLQAMLSESPAMSLTSVCSRVGHSRVFLQETYPEECTSIQSRYRRLRKEGSRHRKEQLNEEIRQIVHKLCRQSVCPTVMRVVPLLSKTVPKDWNLVAAAVKAARQEFKPE